jgi:plastocyanin
MIGGIALGTVLVMIIFSQFGFFSLGRNQAVGSSFTHELETAEMRFSEGVLRLRVGESVTLRLVNGDMVPHSFDVDALNVHAAMPAKQTTTVTFTAAEPGEFIFNCALPGHTEVGMIGKIIVEP